MSQDGTFRGDRFAPVTSAIGFLRTSLGVASNGLTAWRREIHGSASAERLPGGLCDHVHALEPLTGGVAPRELLVATANPEWTAVFDCSIQGSDQTSTIGYLARRLQVQGVTIVSIPDRPQTADLPPRYGARQFELFASIHTGFLNHVRAVSLVREGARWRFDAIGTVQDFENVEAYRQRRVSERFTVEMLVAYAAALGLRPFDEAFFPGPSVLVRNPAVPPPGGLVLSITDAQRRIGILPTA